VSTGEGAEAKRNALVGFSSSQTSTLLSSFVMEIINTISAPTSYSIL